jgi:hypothetical protein
VKKSKKRYDILGFQTYRLTYCVPMKVLYAPTTYQKPVPWDGLLVIVLAYLPLTAYRGIINPPDEDIEF